MKPRVLLIEDNDVNRYLATFVLEHAGLVVLHARDGVEGVERALAERPALIVMDIELPRMDGYEAARRLREEAGTRGIPIVVVSSHAMLSQRQRALDLGVADYIDKPYDPADFAQRILRLLPTSPSHENPGR